MRKPAISTVFYRIAIVLHYCRCLRTNKPTFVRTLKERYYHACKYVRRPPPLCLFVCLSVCLSCDCSVAGLFTQASNLTSALLAQNFGQLRRSLTCCFFFFFFFFIFFGCILSYYVAKIDDVYFSLLLTNFCGAGK